jgi:hypothetical protein
MTTTLNAYYAHDSEVGPVFDVAKYSRAKSLWMGMVGIVIAILVGLAAAYFWNPDWIISKPSKVWAKAHQETKDLMRQHPQGTKVGVAVAGLFGLLFLAAGLSAVVQAVSGDYFVRAGEGGLSLRMPAGLLGIFERDIPWDDVDQLKVVQERQIGALSRNAGNLGGYMRLKTHDGLSRVITLAFFKEDAWLIYDRIMEARDTRPAELLPV